MGNFLSSLFGRTKPKTKQECQVTYGTSDVATVTANHSSNAEDSNALSSYWTDWSRIIRGKPLDEECKRMVFELKKLEKQIAPLEKTEKKLWDSDYKTERMNSDQLLKEIQHRVQKPESTRKGDLANLQKLDRLHHLRHEKYQVVSTLLRRVVPNNLMPRSGSEPESSGSRFWAIIVGVDKYYNDDTLSLKGCTNDATHIWQYLRTELSVPPNHIRVLAEGKFPDKSMRPKPPTRANILHALYDHLWDNKSIRPGDFIIFYFSGRGSSYSSAEVFPPKSGTPAGTIDAICPADRGLKNSKKSCPKTLDISDRELNFIFSEVRDAKAAKVTLIMDCSFAHASNIGGPKSAAVTTGTSDTRAAPPLQDATKHMLLAADNDHRRRSKTLRAHGESWKADEALIVMAACSSGEQARERIFEDDKTTTGVFTRALVSALTSHRNETISYERLRELVSPLEGQTPVVTGARSNAAVWTQADIPDQEMPVDIITR
ncbi:hypothetical protein EWM64_g7097 [Hericium alpestre]|uniref:Peptidase C14 caspase domain-containing protein n=1 Tax=Hericium alpestre TaxID=135208 RepID=A0A4Y9ZQQ4_9AGAM|nr:hypothetical protein EWM64_g7097 [Hericium alpestre]